MGFRQCKQEKCIYNQGVMGCPVCPECKAQSNEVSDDDMCINCYCCEHDMGYVRGGVPDNARERIAQLIKEKQEKEKPMVIEK